MGFLPSGGRRWHLFCMTASGPEQVLLMKTEDDWWFCLTQCRQQLSGKVWFQVIPKVIQAETRKETLKKPLFSWMSHNKAIIKLWWKVIKSLSSCSQCDRGSTTNADVYLVESEDEAAAVWLLQIQSPTCSLIDLKTTCRRPDQIHNRFMSQRLREYTLSLPLSLSLSTEVKETSSSFQTSRPQWRTHVWWGVLVVSAGSFQQGQCWQILFT